MSGFAPNRESCPAVYVPPAKWNSGIGQPAGAFTVRTFGDEEILQAIVPGGERAMCRVAPVENATSWAFNFDFESPTLSPSVKVSARIKGVDREFWHGWLKNGEWQSC